MSARVPQLPIPPDDQDDWEGMKTWMGAVTDIIFASQGLGKNVDDMQPTVAQLKAASITNADRIKK